MILHKILANKYIVCYDRSILVGELEEAFSLARNEFRLKYGVNMPYKDDLNIVTSCYRGARSKKAMETLHRLGFR